MSTVTVMVHYTCAKAVAGTACTGRRRRRSIKLDISKSYNPGAFETLVGSSLNTELEEPEESNDKGKFFTVWKTTTSTLMITSTSYNRDITVSVSLYCTNASMLYDLC
ncbi:uncharacterized protein LOC119575351 [Penaeus monodon]|uniref:uncharacterized protein LOC119575351 n=1 Tax=Penaeus monodon TaxID=6687 RepID=UPI0018A763A6|nr:uncharacterized protein LOC119575351 [Penaeus monodon]